MNFAGIPRILFGGAEKRGEHYALHSDRQLLESALLVVRCQRGDDRAFESLVRLWENSLFYYIRRLAPTEADAWELLQETWLKLFRSMDQLRDPQALPAFLYRIARNVALGRLRRRGVKIVETDASEVLDESAGDDISNFDHAEEVHRALDQLPILQREALTLYFLEDLSLDEMATLLGVPIGTVKSRLHYAKLAIRKILTQGDCHDRYAVTICSAAHQCPGS